MKEDQEGVVRTRYEKWSENLTNLEENYKNCIQSVKGDRDIMEVAAVIRQAIENPMY
jgi:hypothetical protein